MATRKEIFTYGNGSIGFNLFEILDGPDRGKLMYSDKFPHSGRIEVFTTETAKKIRRRVEDRLRKGSIGDILKVAFNLDIISDNLFKE